MLWAWYWLGEEMRRRSFPTRWTYATQKNQLRQNTVDAMTGPSGKQWSIPTPFNTGCNFCGVLGHIIRARRDLDHRRTTSRPRAEMPEEATRPLSPQSWQSAALAESKQLLQREATDLITYPTRGSGKSDEQILLPS